MKKLLIILIVFFAQATFAEPEIEIPVPEELVRVYIKSVLPVDLSEDSDLKGDLKITRIDDFTIRKGGVLFSVTIEGKNLYYFKEEKNYNIKVNINSLNVRFDVDAALTFNKKERILNITPRITKKSVITDTKRVEEHILQVLSLMNNRVYSIRSQDIEPHAQKILGDRINLKITDFNAEDKAIYLKTIMDLGKLFR